MNRFVKIMLGGLMTATTVFAAAPQVKNVKAFQQYPWSGNVYISYEVTGDISANAGSGPTPFLYITACDRSTGRQYGTISSDFKRYLFGDTGTNAGLHKVVWDLEAQGVAINSSNVVFRVDYRNEYPKYLIIDLSLASCPISYLDTLSSEDFDTYKTTKLALRLIQPGSFMMCGSYHVTLTKPFYCGIFEVTQKQYNLVTTRDPSDKKGDMRPVELVSYDMIRGSNSGWPVSSHVYPTSFMGQLRSRTGLSDFDLPTEAQWEYACRAETTSAFNNGGDSDYDLEILGRCILNWGDDRGGYSGAHTTVGSYLPNGWGLYDMHGNVQEWCLDWYGSLTGNVTDPQGPNPSSGKYRITRGGGYLHGGQICSSSHRGYFEPHLPLMSVGFRIVRTLSE